MFLHISIELRVLPQARDQFAASSTLALKKTLTRFGREHFKPPLTFSYHN